MWGVQDNKKNLPGVFSPQTTGKTWARVVFQKCCFPFASLLRKPVSLVAMEGTICRTGNSIPNMTGRPGYRTMEMIGGSSAPYLVCTLIAFPCFVSRLIGVETEGFLD